MRILSTSIRDRAGLEMSNNKAKCTMFNSPTFLYCKEGNK